MINNCSSCRFWHAWTQQPTNNTGPSIGDCRRHAPVLVPVLVQSPANVALHVTAAQIKTKWPSVKANDFCGEHQPIETEGQA
jgi:hypothetical protein